MNTKCSKGYSFDIFLQEWGRQYADLQSILFYLKTYPDVLSKINLEPIINPNNIDAEQRDWIWLCEKFYHPLEKEFFKPYWIPIVKDSLDYFIDISDDSYPIFEVEFFWLEPYKWYKKFLTHNVIEILLAPDEGSNIDELKNRIEYQHWSTIQDLFKKRRNL